jgi:hypothetical protein
MTELRRLTFVIRPERRADDVPWARQENKQIAGHVLPYVIPTLVAWLPGLNS